MIPPIILPRQPLDMPFRFRRPEAQQGVAAGVVERALVARNDMRSGDRPSGSRSGRPLVRRSDSRPPCPM
jgi:hypothetical protein